LEALAAAGAAGAALWAVPIGAETAAAGRAAARVPSGDGSSR
jgi:hypothetical protein